MIRRTMEWTLGIPWVFERARWWVLGGFDFRPAYDALDVRPSDVVLDIGCGMGDAMRHLGAFAAYHGFDIDARAVDAFRQRCPRNDVHLYARACTAEDVARIQPTKVVMIGILHHMSDMDVHPLLSAIAMSGGRPRVATIDTVIIPRYRSNNFLARFERGRWVRTVDQYDALARASGFRVDRSFWIETGRHVARYYGMVLEPSAR